MGFSRDAATSAPASGAPVSDTVARNCRTSRPSVLLVRSIERAQLYCHCDDNVEMNAARNHEISHSCAAKFPSSGRGRDLPMDRYVSLPRLGVGRFGDPMMEPQIFGTRILQRESCIRTCMHEEQLSGCGVAPENPHREKPHAFVAPHASRAR